MNSDSDDTSDSDSHNNSDSDNTSDSHNNSDNTSGRPNGGPGEGQETRGDLQENSNSENQK